MLNCAVIMGRLVADPELRTTGSGISVTSFTVAVDRSYQKAGTERQTDLSTWSHGADGRIRIPLFPQGVDDCRAGFDPGAFL